MLGSGRLATAGQKEIHHERSMLGRAVRRTQAIWQHGRAGRARPGGGAPGAAGRPRSERRRQDDRDLAAPGIAASGRRHRTPLRPVADDPRGPAPDRCDDAGGLSGAGAARPRAGRPRRELLPGAAGRRRRPGEDPHHGAGPSPLRQALGRAEAPGAACDGGRRPAAAPVPRRAHGRARSAGAGAAVGRRCAISSTREPRSSSPPTTSKRPRRWPTGWRSSARGA